MGCGNTFKTISSDEVSCNIESKSLGIDKEDCLGTVLAKLVAKVEYLWNNKCNSENVANDYPKEAISKEELVDYSLNPIITAEKGSRTNKVKVDWKSAVTPNKDEIVRKNAEIYTNNGTRLIASSNKGYNEFELKPSDYPLDVVMKAYVKTEKAGMVVAEKVVPVSGDLEAELSPALEVKKNMDIEDPAIAILNAEIAKLKELLDLKADKNG